MSSNFRRAPPPGRAAVSAVRRPTRFPIHGVPRGGEFLESQDVQRPQGVSSSGLDFFRVVTNGR